MDMLNVDETSAPSKIFNPYALGFGSNQTAAGLLSLHRWITLTTQQIADSTGYTYHYVTGQYKKNLLRRGIIKQVQSSLHDYKAGRPPQMFTLAKAGYELLCENVNRAWGIGNAKDVIGNFREPPKEAKWGTGTPHVYEIIDAAIAIEKAARQLDGVEVVAIIPEFTAWNGRADPTLLDTGISRKLRADMAVILRRGDFTWLVFVEVDRGSESQTTENPDNIYDTIEGKARLYWRCLERCGGIMGQFNVTAPAFQVMFVCKSQQRADNMAENIRTLGLRDIGVAKPEFVFLFGVKRAAQQDFFGAHWNSTTSKGVSPC